MPVSTGVLRDHEWFVFILKGAHLYVLVKLDAFPFGEETKDGAFGRCLHVEAQILCLV